MRARLQISTRIQRSLALPLVLGLCLGAPGQEKHSPTPPYRGIALLSSSIDQQIPPEEILAFTQSCRLNLVVIDFAWITHHWPQTDLAAVAQLAQALEQAGVEVALMYRPRVLQPSDADVRYAVDNNGDIAEHHNELCFADEGTREWAARWGTRLLRACPAVDRIILYNLRPLCQCPQCRNGRAREHIAEFLQLCRAQWQQVRPNVSVGHVGLADEYASKVDVLCPFIPLQRSGDTPVDAQALVAKARLSQAGPAQRPVIPLVKICWAGATNNTTDDVVRVIRACDASRTSFILWYYEWLFHSAEDRYDQHEVIGALGGQWSALAAHFVQKIRAAASGQKHNAPNAWIYFDSKESRTGRPPQLLLEFAGAHHVVPIAADTALISYLADRLWGNLPTLGINMDDTNRALVQFDLTSLKPTGPLKQAELVLELHNSQVPIVAPFELAVHSVTERWSEQATNWNNQPAFQERPDLTLKVEPTEQTLRVDASPIVRRWLSGSAPNHGLLLKVATPLGDRPGRIAGQPAPELTPARPDASRQKHNAPNSWIYFDSKESGAGRHPRLLLDLAEARHPLPAAADATLISYLADRAWGHMPTLAISMNDGNRVLVQFDLTSLKSTGPLKQAELLLELHNSRIPVVAPFELGVHLVTQPWTEQAASWKHAPAFEEQPDLVQTIEPAEQTLRLDISPIVRRWLNGDTPNHGLLLKVAAPLGGRPGPVASDALPELTPPPAVTAAAEKLPWPHQPPGLSASQVDELNREVWIINNFPLYQADPEGKRRYFHSGLDIVLENGTKIYAMKDGWVKSVEQSTVLIADRQDDAPSYGWAYTHLGDFQVKPGDFVKRGTPIGSVAFHGLAHIHLEKAWCEGENWGSWRHACTPDAHFTYVDSEPPVIKSPFLFFKNNTDDQFRPDNSGRIVLSGEVDIVVGARDAGQHAHSSKSGFGDRLAIAAIDYEIRPADEENAAPQCLHSFDFRRLAIKHSVYNWQFNTALTKVIYKHWTLCEPGAHAGDKVFSYYVITNCPGSRPPTELRLSDRGFCWNTAAVDDHGKRVYPDGLYDVMVRASDYAGNQSSARMRVALAQLPEQ